jgi:small GTP-binding protein
MLMESPLSLKIIIIGESGTGKSCLLLKYIDETFEYSHNSTIGVDFRFKNMRINETFVKLSIWDTAGQERFQSIIRSYYAGISGIVLVFDLNVRSTFTRLNYWIDEIKSMNKHNCPIMLVGNKSDIRKSEISDDEINNFIDETHMDISYIEVSVRRGTNVNNVFEELAKKMVTRVENNKSLQVNHDKPNLQFSSAYRLNCCTVS